jgi:hypothetical protein
MIAMAERRNAVHGRKARFVTASVEAADLGDETYDKVFAVHVAALHRPGPALAVVRERLRPGGTLCLVNQAPGWTTTEPAHAFGADLGRVLETAGFTVRRTLAKALAGGAAAAVVATAP